MSKTLNLRVLGNLGEITVRIFSLRGAHLVAMFARTQKAQSFRVWVLDLIEQHQNMPSLMQQWFDTKAKLETESAVASLCGKGLNRWRTVKHRLKNQLVRLESEMQPTLFLG